MAGDEKLRRLYAAYSNWARSPHESNLNLQIAAEMLVRALDLNQQALEALARTDPAKSAELYRQSCELREQAAAITAAEKRRIML